MGLMNFLRNRAGVVIVFCIGFAIVAFLLGDVISYGTPFWARHQNQVGNINGQAIDYNEFNQQVDQTTEMYRQQMGGELNPQMKTWAVEQVWTQYLNRELLHAEIDKIGLTVGRAELNELVSGPNPSMQIIQAFSNPQTGQFDPGQLNMFISQVSTLAPNHEASIQWNALLENVVTDQLSAKYNNLVNNSVYVTSLEAQDEYVQRNKVANFNYALLDYANIHDDAITLTDADYKNYYDQNRKLFVNEEETRSLQFVEFDASPVAQDSARVLEQIQSLAAQLSESTADSLFAAVNSDNLYPYIYFRQGALSPALDTLLFTAPVGSVVGPVLSNGMYEIAKVVDSRISPDSVKASHILLDPLMEGGLDQAQAKADSIRTLIRSGESLAGLAIQYSVDEGSKINGGELGTFPRGAMVPEFENAVFDAKTGDVIIVNSQFGVHIVRIENQIGSSRVVKAAIIDKLITSGKETIDAAYAQANSFFTGIQNDDLEGLAGSQGVQLRDAEHLNARATMLGQTMVKRELIRWAFEAKSGEVSDRIYESEDNSKYIIAKVVDVRPEGQLPLSAVKDQITVPVRNMVKANELVAQATEAVSAGGNLEAIAQRLGVTSALAENVTMSNPIIPSVAMEPAVVGTVFGAEVNQPSKPVKGNQGVYVVEVVGFVNPEVPADLSEQKQVMAQGHAQRVWSLMFRALTEKAKVVDNRARFF